MDALLRAVLSVAHITFLPNCLHTHFNRTPRQTERLKYFLPYSSKIHKPRGPVEDKAGCYVRAEQVNPDAQRQGYRDMVGHGIY